MSDPSWSDLDRRPAPPRDDRLAQICSVVFTTPHGKALLAELRRLHFDTPCEPITATDRALAVRAANQHFVRELEMACERGLKANAKPNV